MILFIGRSTLDLGYICPSFPEEDSKLSSEGFTMSGGGPALNAAITASALGTPARLVSAVGGGVLADFVRSELHQHGVELLDLARPEDAALPVSSIIVVPQNGSRTVLDQRPTADLRMVEDVDALLEGVDLVLTDGQFAPVALALVQRARELSIPTVLDGGSWKPGMREIFASIEYAIVSERFSPPGHETDDLSAAINRLGPVNVAITRGAGPIGWSEGSDSGAIHPPRVDAVDTLGAGDIFHGAFCHYLAGGSTFVAALERAARIAALSCTRPGTRAWIADAARA